MICQIRTACLLYRLAASLSHVSYDTLGIVERICRIEGELANSHVALVRVKIRVSLAEVHRTLWPLGTPLVDFGNAVVAIVDADLMVHVSGRVPF